MIVVVRELAALEREPADDTTPMGDFGKQGKRPVVKKGAEHGKID
jgi:hypothetical protein